MALEASKAFGLGVAQVAKRARELVRSAGYSGRSPYNVACAAVFAAVKGMLPKVSKREFSERAGLVSVHSLADVWLGAFKAVVEGGRRDGSERGDSGKQGASGSSPSAGEAGLSTPNFPTLSRGA